VIKSKQLNEAICFAVVQLRWMVA